MVVMHVAASSKQPELRPKVIEGTAVITLTRLDGPHGRRARLGRLIPHMSLPRAFPTLLLPSCGGGGGEEKLVDELEEATVRKNRGIFFLHYSRQLPVQSLLFRQFQAQ